MTESYSNNKYISRRYLIGSVGAFGLSTILPLNAFGKGEPDKKDVNVSLSSPKHGMSIFGGLKYPEDFKHFSYVNPSAPKGGEIALTVGSVSGNQTFLTFDTLNMFSQRGNGAAGMGMIFDSLMVGSSDEPDSLYCLVAKSVQSSEDGLIYRFKMHSEAHFHDSSPLRAEDVVFSVETLKSSKAHVSYRLLLKQVESVKAISPLEVEFIFSDGRSRELPIIAASLPIFSKAYYEKRDFDEASLESPLGSGAYKVEKFEQGHSIIFKRVPNYWAKDLPVSVGQANFDNIRYEYFRDREAMFQAFTAGVYSFREEFTSLIWETRYNFPAITDGKVKKAIVSDGRPSGTQGWFFNTRLPKFSDPRIREAISLCFDFEWTNKNLMFGLYKRTNSYFENSPLKAEGLPSTEELAVLEPFRDKIPKEIFDQPAYSAPVTDGSEQNRQLLRSAIMLLEQAGVKAGKDGNMYLKDGNPLSVEFLEEDSALEKHVNGFINSLKLIGIPATIRLVDPAQFALRKQGFDFEIMMQRFSMSLTPGEGLKLIFGSEAAKYPGSRNLAGIADPVIDAMIEKIILAKTREELTIATRALDRILRAGKYWVSAWYAATHKIAWWDRFGMPENIIPPLAGSADGAAASLWWYDSEKASRQ